MILQRALPAMFDDALVNGTLSWDAIISKALALCLYSSLSSLAGATISSIFRLRFRDIKLRVMERSEGDDGIRLAAEFTLRIGNRTTSFDMHDLNNNALSTCDPIKLLMVHALRTGAVDGTTLSEHFTRAEGKPIVLKFPDHALIYGSTGYLHNRDSFPISEAGQFLRNAIVLATRSLGSRTPSPSINEGECVAQTCSDLGPPYIPERSEVSSSAMEFIASFSKINEVKTRWEKTFDHARIGGSRDMPTRFKSQCPNVEHGCTAVFTVSKNLRNHVKVCPSTSKEAHRIKLQKEALRVFKCPECARTFTDERYARFHLKVNHHDWHPQLCPEPGCRQDHIYHNHHTLRIHIRDKHTDWMPSRCPFCNTTEHSSASSFRSHVRQYHPELDKHARSALYQRMREDGIAARKKEGKPTTHRLEGGKIVFC